MSHKNLKTNSILVHGADIKEPFGAAVTPIYQTSTFKFENAEQGAAFFAGEEPGYIYTRIGNPTITALETTLAKLENGAGCVVCSSGMAAVNMVYMSFLRAGDHMISSAAVYGCSRVVMDKYWNGFGVESTYVDTSKLKNIEDSIKPNTKLLYIETPTNPTISLTDIRKASEIAHKHNIIVVVDNTFSSPLLQKPLELGADVVLHSMTKFINGHADIVAGAVISKTSELNDIVRSTMINGGFNMDPTQAYMVIRGLKTLSIRVNKQQENAIELANWLEKHPKIEWVRYPGLESYPQYKLAKEQMIGPGSVMSFQVKGGLEAGKKFMNNINMILLAVSLGGVESLISHPASMTHSKMAEKDRLACGITDGLVRFAVGIEDIEDLKEDLSQALDKI